MTIDERGTPVPSRVPARRVEGGESGMGHRPSRAVLASTVVKRPIDWLWKPFLQKRAINLISGDPGVGKSTIICEIVAALSRGRPLPGDPPELRRAPMTCWIMNAEDANDDTTVWRLENQGADLTRVLLTDQRDVISAQVAEEIGDECRRLQVGFLSIDPLQSWMGKDVDMNRANETRDWGSGLRAIAMRLNMAVLLNRHRRKGQPGDNKLYSGLGSIDITALARSELSVSKDKHGNCFVERTKGNVGLTGGTLGYVLESSSDPNMDHGTLKWTGPVTKPEPEAGKVSRIPARQGLAMNWLEGLLAKGPVPAIEVLRLALEMGISETTLHRAKKELGIKSHQHGGNEWVWANE